MTVFPYQQPPTTGTTGVFAGGLFMSKPPNFAVVGGSSQYNFPHSKRSLESNNDF